MLGPFSNFGTCQISQLQESLELVWSQLTVAQNLRHETRPDRFARVDWYNRCPTIRMLEEMVASLDST